MTRESPPNRTNNAWLDEVVIRTVGSADLPDLEWNGEYTHFRRLFADAYQRSLQGRSVLWVAELPEVGLIGQIFVQLASDRFDLADGSFKAYIYSFRVRASYRNQGLGAKLLRHVETNLVERGFQVATLNVARDNPRALAFYERYGYQVIATEPGVWSYLDDKGYYHRVEEPAWRMEKPLKL